MHNKPIVMDKQMTICRGCNVGNQYFGTGNSVLVAGHYVIEVGLTCEVSTAFYQ